jgi:hypothetical protein
MPVEGRGRYLDPKHLEKKYYSDINSNKVYKVYKKGPSVRIATAGLLIKSD